MLKTEVSTPIDIKNYLPHRAPMLMVDLVLSMDEQQVETTFEIKKDNIFLENNRFTEAGLIENAAQTCSSVVGKRYFVDEHNEDKADVHVVGFISTIKDLKIHALAFAGSTIRTKAILESKFVNEDYSLCNMRFQIFNGEEVLLEGTINLFIRENVKLIVTL